MGVLVLMFGFAQISTTAIADLLLNCAALEFILNVDETVFKFAPAHIKSMLSNLEPLRIPRTVTYQRLDRISIISAIGSMAILVLVMVMGMVPQIEVLECPAHTPVCNIP